MSLKNIKKQQRPEDIIIGTDPVAIDIIQQIYAAIKDKSESDRTFLERCWVLGIEKAYKTDTKKLDPELCTNLLERIYFHLEHKNIWEVEENKLYDIFERIISLKTLRDSNIKEIFDDLEKSLSSVLQLDFSYKVAINYSGHEKRNIFNYIVFFFNSIIEKIEASMISAKAINAFFSIYPGISLIVTDNNGRVRFINETGLNLIGINAEEGITGLNAKNIISNYATVISKLRKKGRVSDFKTNIMACGKNSAAIAAKVSVPQIAINKSEIEEIVFVVKPENP